MGVHPGTDPAAIYNPDVGPVFNVALPQTWLQLRSFTHVTVEKETASVTV